tara:strand:+ start:311 stop:703 length:393 start_codon:yes stop_codon:yes gene_type:complete
VFDDLFILEKERSNKQAVGFYLAYFIILILGVMLLGSIWATFIFAGSEASFAEGFDAGSVSPIGPIVATLTTLALSVVILYKKKINGLGPIVIALFSGLAAVLGGGLLGLIPTAYLTTLKNESAQKLNEW